MANNTYVELDKVTIGSTTTSATFNSIPQTYTDLVVVMNVVPNGSGAGTFIVNGDTSAIYSNTTLAGLDTNTPVSFRSTGLSSGNWLSSGAAMTNSANLHLSILHFMNYSNTTTFKTILNRENPGQFGYTGYWANLYRSTSAITSITMQYAASFGVGTTVSLYGIKSESASSTPKATGGTIYSDTTYFYHIFGASGTFTPTSTITADAVVVGGGGGGGWNNGGGGGGGEIAVNTGGTYTSGTGYTVTIGNGGATGTSQTVPGYNGGNSSISSITTALGGGGGGSGDGTGGNQNGKTGGSGGGASLTGTVGGSASGSNTNAGGAPGFGAANNYHGAGGGGATSAGTAAASGNPGDGGEGKAISTIFSGLNLSGINILASGGGGGGYLASGTMELGRGGTNGGNGAKENSATGNLNPVAGVHNSGSGGGGGAYTGVNSRNGAAGGSGIVIIRYLKA
jgi:hypothetical protein